MGVGVSAHRLLQTRDCIVPNCIHEAENGTDRCRNHLEWAPGDGIGASLLEAIVGVAGEEVEVGDVTEPKADTKTEVEPGICKRDGCGRPHNTQYDRGIFAKLCVEHIEEARTQQSERSKAARGSRSSSPLSKPEPAPSVPGDDGFEARAQRLVDAGRLVDEARRGLEVARRQADEIITAAGETVETAEAEWVRLLREESER